MRKNKMHDDMKRMEREAMYGRGARMSPNDEGKGKEAKVPKNHADKGATLKEGGHEAIPKAVRGRMGMVEGDKSPEGRVSKGLGSAGKGKKKAEKDESKGMKKMESKKKQAKEHESMGMKKAMRKRGKK